MREAPPHIKEWGEALGIYDELTEILSVSSEVTILACILSKRMAVAVTVPIGSGRCGIPFAIVGHPPG